MKAFEIRRAADAPAASMEDVGIDHRRLNSIVVQQFLHGADVRAGLNEMRRERMSECVCRHALREITPSGRGARSLRLVAVRIAGEALNACRGRTRLSDGSRFENRPEEMAEPVIVQSEFDEVSVLSAMDLLKPHLSSLSSLATAKGGSVARQAGWVRRRRADSAKHLR